MFQNILNFHIFGIEFQPNGIATAEFSIHGHQQVLKKLSFYQPDFPPPFSEGMVVSGIEGDHLLVRSLYLPLIKEKDIREALPFQVEPLLPYPIEEATFVHRTLETDHEGSLVSIFATHESSMTAHLEKWSALKISPEKVSCVPLALCSFVQKYVSKDKTLLVFHIAASAITGVLIKNNHAWSSFSIASRLDAEEPSLQDWAAKISMIALSLTREVKEGGIESFILTGNIDSLTGLEQLIAENLNLSPMQAEAMPNFSSVELHRFAVPIGLALEALPAASQPVDFRKERFAYPNPWKHYVKPLSLYFLLVFLLTTSLYFLGQSYLSYQTSLYQQSFIDLLAKMGKSYHKFDEAYREKTRDLSESDPEKFLAYDEIADRLHFLKKEVQSIPESFPLFPNVPRVSDVLAWLSNHPAVLHTESDGTVTPRIKLESFSYSMVKRPMQGKKQDRYQVKIDLEISSSTPKWAREFHDALLAPNDWVDPKSEVKWNANRGKYRTTFFLKDKTTYPG